jgi:uncharacterized protein YjbJ (UPF0337 family)
VRNDGPGVTVGAWFAGVLPSTIQELAMNKDQVKGTAKEVAGKVQEKTGKVIGSEGQQAKGMAKQVAGKAQKSAGDVKEVVKDASKRKA